VNIESVFVPTVVDVCVRVEQCTGTKNCSGFGLVKKLKLVISPLNGQEIQTKIWKLKVCIILDSNGKYIKVYFDVQTHQAILINFSVRKSPHRTSFVLNSTLLFTTE